MQGITKPFSFRLFFSKKKRPVEKKSIEWLSTLRSKGEKETPLGLKKEKRKGITPVIAIILLLLITISIVGFSFMFFQRTTETASQSGEEQLKQQTSQAGTSVRIDAVSENKIYVRNMGTTDVPANSLKAFVDGAQVDISSDSLAKSSTGSIVLDATKLPKVAGEHTLKVTSAGNSDTLKIKYPVVGILNEAPYNSGGAGAPTAAELDTTLTNINVPHELASSVDAWADNLKSGKYDIAVVPYTHNLPVFKKSCTVTTNADKSHSSPCQGDPDKDIWIIMKNFINAGGTFIGSWAIPFYCFDYNTGSGWATYKGAAGSEYSAGGCCGGCGNCGGISQGCYETPERFYAIGFGSPSTGAWCGEWCWSDTGHMGTTQEGKNVFQDVPDASRDPLPSPSTYLYRTTGNLDFNFFSVHNSLHSGVTAAPGYDPAKVTKLTYSGAKKYGSGYFIWMSGTGLFDPSESSQTLANSAWKDMISWIFKQKK